MTYIIDQEIKNILANCSKSKTASSRREEKALKAITDEIKEDVIMRYLRYCRDQQSAKYELWREKAFLNPAFNSEQIAALKFRLYTTKTWYDLRDSKGEVILEDFRSLGHEVEELIPCLSSHYSEADRKNPEIMSQRFNEPFEYSIKLDKEDISLEEIAQLYPLFIDFIPSPDVLKQLIDRIKKSKKSREGLWDGFKRLELPNGEIVYQPIPEMLF